MKKPILLRHCPMCGQSPDGSESWAFGITYEHTSGGVRVTCGCGMASGYCKNIEKAAQSWNSLKEEEIRNAPFSR